MEESKKQQFDSKPAVELFENCKLKFNGAVLSRNRYKLTITQSTHIGKLSGLDPLNFTKMTLSRSRRVEHTLKHFSGPI